MVVDFHSHILPGIDHGSDSIKTSLRQIALASRFGIKNLVATSHFYPHSRITGSFIERRELAYKELIDNMCSSNIRVLLGAEILICNAIDKLEFIDKLCIRGTNVLLLELPFSDFQIDFCRSIYNLVSSGYKVVMAHAERYDRDWISETIEAGAKLQVNASALSLFNIRRVSTWLEDGSVVAIGSDIHGVNSSAYRKFVSAAKKVERYNQIKEFSNYIISCMGKTL